MTANVMLEVRDLRVVYPGGVEALKGATLSVGRGEIVALIGRSGAGKSTLLRCLNGLQPISAGMVRVGGADIGSLSSRELAGLRRRVGFIWQEHNLVLRLSAFTNVLTGRLGHRASLLPFVGLFSRADRAVAVNCLERVCLLHRAGQRADRLSGGERQRVAIARALAQQPEVLLADEPVASLDRALSWSVMRDLVAIAREQGVPTLISLHDVALARAFADRIVGLAGGITVFNGAPSGLDEGVLDGIYGGCVTNGV
ncbi:MAG: phosphonate ABC transporter ATP-binding protein [Vicinamibacterales bacterium]